MRPRKTSDDVTFSKKGADGVHRLNIAKPASYCWFCKHNVGKRLVKSPKTYLRDSGVLHALLGLVSLEDVLGHGSPAPEGVPHCLRRSRSRAAPGGLSGNGGHDAAGRYRDSASAGAHEGAFGRRGRRLKESGYNGLYSHGSRARGTLHKLTSRSERHGRQQA